MEARRWRSILGAAARGAGASEADLVATEQRLGVRLPPEVRAFYAATDGCGTVEEFVYSLRPHGSLTWARDDGTLAALAEEDLACGDVDGERLLRSLVLTDDADAGYVVLDPQDGAVGHWHAWWAAPWTWHPRLAGFFAAVRE